MVELDLSEKNINLQFLVLMPFLTSLPTIAICKHFLPQKLNSNLRSKGKFCSSIFMIVDTKVLIFKYFFRPTKVQLNHSLLNTLNMV